MEKQTINSNVAQQPFRMEIPMIGRKRAHSANYDSRYNLQGVLFSKLPTGERKAPTYVVEKDGVSQQSEAESTCLIIDENKGMKNVKDDEDGDDDDDDENNGDSDGCEVKTTTEKGKSTFSGLKRRQKCILIICTFTYLMEGLGFSLLAPFFPQEAFAKGMSPALTGFVFSVFELMIFITSPIFGAYLTQLGPRFVVLAGVFAAGICNILFGTLALCPPGKPFIILSILCRSVEAIGYSSYSTAIMAIVTSAFPKDVITTFAVLETANGIGMMVGPAIGGALYELGGFGLPFYVVGSCILINGIIVYFVIPEGQDTLSKKTVPVSKLSLLRSPMLVIGMVSICVVTLGEAFLEPTLSKHLDSFNLSVAVIGLFFVIGPLLSTLLSPLWGFLADKKEFHRELMVVGFFVYGLGFLFIGPSALLPFLPFELWVIAVGLILSGAFFGCSIIAPIKCMLTGAMDVGFEENVETCAIVSGLYNSMYSFGAFLGPLVGGVLVEAVGNSQAYTFVGLGCFGMGIICFVFFVTRQSRCSGNAAYKYQPLP